MAQEIERKYLIDEDILKNLNGGIRIKQAYLPTEGYTVVRLRIAGEKAFLTIKGKNKGSVRTEFEYEIPLPDAEAMIAELCVPEFIDKTRYLLDHEGHQWEIDVFHGDNAGLVVAELELDSEDEHFSLPSWALTEVTNEPKYYNSSLLELPFSKWH